MVENKEMEQIAEQLVNLKIKDAVELSRLLKEKYGIEPPMATTVVSSASSGPASAEKSGSEEKTSFDVVLKSAGAAKLQVIKVLKEILTISLTEAKAIADEGNKVIKSNLSKDAADDIKKQLADAGAIVEIK